MLSAVGHGTDVDSLDAIREALDQCEGQLQGRRPNAAILFAATTMDHQVLLDAVYERHPGIELVGCTTDGELSSRVDFTDDSVVLILLASDRIKLGAGVGRNASAHPGESAREAVAQASAQLGAAASLCLAFPESILVNSSDVVAGLRSALGADVPVAGGNAGSDPMLSRPTLQFYGREVLADAVPILLFGGDLRMGCGVAFGWKSIGARHQITRSSGRVVYEMDGKPAAEVYGQYVSAASSAMYVHHPLAIFEADGRRHYLRGIIGLGKEPGSLVCGADVPEGSTVQLTEYERSNVLDAVDDATRQAVAAFGTGSPSLALAFSCTSRKGVLGTWTDRECQRMRALIPAAVPVAGFYTFGELAWLDRPQEARVHNCTIVMLLLGSS